jgi:hypothetical protein
MKSSTPLGTAIEAAVFSNPKFVMRREPVKYLCYFRTLTGREDRSAGIRTTQSSLKTGRLARYFISKPCPKSGSRDPIAVAVGVATRWRLCQF